MLAAGRGRRMGGGVPKVLRLLAGVPMVRLVVNCLTDAGVAPVCVVVGPESGEVRQALPPDVLYAVQQEPLGSGDAAAAAADVLGGVRSAEVVVACGDSPLFEPATVRELVEEHRRSAAVATLTSAELDDPTGYGRILRGQNGQVRAIVEEVEAAPDERRVREVNGGLYVFDARWLWEKLRLASAAYTGSRGEFVLTRIVQDAARAGEVVAATACDPSEIAGVNTPEQLAEAEAMLAARRLLHS